MSLRMMGAATLVVLSIVGAAWAQSGSDMPRQGMSHQGMSQGMPSGMPEGMHHGGFERLDPNGDGKSTWEEFQAAFPKTERRMFDALDNDKSGTLERNEWALHKEGFHGAAKQTTKEKGASPGAETK